MRYEEPAPQAQELIWDDDDDVEQPGNGTDQGVADIGTTRAAASDFFSRYQRYDGNFRFFVNYNHEGEGYHH